MPRKVVKGTTENLNMLREKVDYIGFELGEVPEFLKDFEPLEYRVPKVYDETTYKVYMFVGAWYGQDAHTSYLAAKLLL